MYAKRKIPLIWLVGPIHHLPTLGLLSNVLLLIVTQSTSPCFGCVYFKADGKLGLEGCFSF